MMYVLLSLACILIFNFSFSFAQLLYNIMLNKYNKNDLRNYIYTIDSLL